MEEKHKDNIKKSISELLKRLNVDIDGVHIPLLNSKTSQIIINCNDGEVAEVKPSIKIKAE